MDGAAQVHAAFALVHRADLQASIGEVVLSAWCPTMDLCAAVTSDGQLAVHRMNWQQLWALAPEAPVTALAWRPDGKLLATGHADGGLAVWDVETGEAVVRHARAHFAPVAALDWSLTPFSARIDHDDDRWGAAGAAVAAAMASGGGAEAGHAAAAAAAHCRLRFSAAASAATAAAFEDRHARLFPPDGLVLLTAGASGVGGSPSYGGSGNKEDPYAELFRGAPPLAAGARGDASAAGGNNHGLAAAATWEVLPPADAPVSCPPLDLLCAADRRGCLSAWIGAGRVQIGDVAGLAPRVEVAAAAAAAADDGGAGDGGGERAAPPAPPPAATLVALCTAVDQSACVSVAWHPPPPSATAAAAAAAAAAATGGGYRDGLVAAPMATRPLRAARREVRQWARLHWRLRGLLESADLALKAAAREWASAASTVRKRVLDELAEALAAHDDAIDDGDDDAIDGDDDDQDDQDGKNDADDDAAKIAAAIKRQDPRGDLMLLLATGAATPGVHAWLTASLGEAGVQRAARAVDAALERAHALLLRSCLPALERAAFCLGELRGLAAASCSAAGPGGRGALLGLSAPALEPLEAAAVRAVVRAEQVRVAVGDLAAGHRALFTWLLRTTRQLESASAAGAGDNAADQAAAAASLGRPPPEPPTGPDAALSDVLLPFLDEGGPVACDPLSVEFGQRDGPLDAPQRRAAARWLHGGGTFSGGDAEGAAAAAEDGGALQAALGPEAVVTRVLRILYQSERSNAVAAAAVAMAGGAAFGGGEADGGGGGGPASSLSLAGQVAALAEACDEALAGPQSSVSARLTVGAPVCLAPAAALCPSAGPSAAPPPPPPRVSVAPAGDGRRQEDDGAGGDNNNGDGDGGDGWSPDDGVVICVVVPAAGLAAIAPPADVDDRDAATAADGILVVRVRAAAAAPAVVAAALAPPPPTAAGGGMRGPAPGLELRLSAVLVCGDPGARVVDAVPYKCGQLAVLSSAAVGGAAERDEEDEEEEEGARSAAATPQRRQHQQQQPRPPPVLALLDLSSAPFVDVSVSTSATNPPAATTTSALEACLARGAVVGAADLAAAAGAGAVRAARLDGFAAAVAPLAVSRARGLALVLSDMQRLAVLDVDADDEGAEEED